MDIAVVYAITAAVALLLAFGYCWMIKEKNIWFLLLFMSVCVVNLGYFSLAISRTLTEAMLANRISYLGSVFLPLCMLMIILELCRIQPGRAFVGASVLLSIVTFLIAASAGYVDWYYKEVTLEFVNGAAKLNKVYGPLHNWYPIYLALYFSSMLIAIFRTAGSDAVPRKHTVRIALIVLTNMGIWLLEQLVDLNFEYLSVSYIISELLLLLLHDFSPAEEAPAQSTPAEPAAAPGAEVTACLTTDPQRLALAVEACVARNGLTAREREVLCALAADKRRKEIAGELFVSENTVKKHVSHIYEKLGVTNRRELMEYLENQAPQPQ